MTLAIPWHCSLTAHHAYLSHLPQKLDQVVSENLDAGAWKIRFGRRGTQTKSVEPEAMGGDELCLYNAADCRVTAKAWKKLQADLAAERQVYEHDMCLAELCLDMQRAGIRVDRAFQSELSRKLGEAADEQREEMRKLVGDPTFQPSKPEHVRKALYQTFGLRKLVFTATGLPATGKAVLESLRGEDTPAGKFATLLSRRREYLKIKKTYVDFPTEICFRLPADAPREPYGDDPDRAHYQWGAREKRDSRTEGGGHTVSGRLACRIQSAPRYNKLNLPSSVRWMYIAAEGNEFVYFDVSQGEPRVAAFLSGDPERIKTTYGDVHAENAKVMFPEIAALGWLDGELKKDPTKGKPLRDLAKNMGLAIDYFAEADKVYTYLLQHCYAFDGRKLFNPPSPGQCTVIINKIRHRYKVYVRFVEANHARVKRLGYMRSPVLGRIRWLGWAAPITDVSNYPIQATLADVMNLRSLWLQGGERFGRWVKANPEIAERVSLPKKRPVLPPGTRLVSQIHDSCFYDTPRRYVPEVRGILTELWKAPVHLPGGELVLPIDLKNADRWATL